MTLRPLLAALVLLNALDVATTHVGLARGASEANRFLGENLAWHVAVKVAVIAAMAYFALRHPRPERAALWVGACCAFYVGVVAHNTWVIGRLS